MTRASSLASRSVTFLDRREPQLAALVVAIATINAYNRLNAATRQLSGEWVDRIAQAARRPAGASSER